MTWHHLLVPAASNAGAASAEALIDEYVRLYREAGMPAAAAVFHRRGAAGHEYVFSPEAARIANGLLKWRGAAALRGMPNLDTFRRVWI